jgi:HlyD family secretion protein
MRLYWLVNNGHAAIPTTVRFGTASDRRIQVVSSLRPGDEVIVSDTSDFEGAKHVVLR